MNKAIINGNLINPDKKNEINNSLILIKGNKIFYAGKKKDFNSNEYEIINANNKIIIPGIINAHSHGIIYNTPLFSSGSKPLTKKQTQKNLLKHLKEGTTTLLNVDGFVNIYDLINTQKETPINLKTAIAYSKLSYEAAKKIDGKGIKQNFNHEKILNKYENLIVAFGESGSGATLGGGVQDYKFIPEMIKQKYGINIDETLAREIKEAILGREIDPKNYNKNKLKQILDENNLNLNINELKKEISDLVLLPFEESLNSIKEMNYESIKYNLPIIIHNAAASNKLIDKISSENNNYRIIAGHSNHPSYTLNEALNFAKELKKRNVIIDISTFDTLNTNNKKEIDYFFAFLENDLTDMISTDYGGGNHTGILNMLDLAIKEKVIDLPKAIQLITYNPSKYIPLIGEKKGLIKEDYIADFVMLNNRNLYKVEDVFIEGKKII